MQTCPWLKKIAPAEPAAAMSRLVSSRMITGDLPPSSREKRVMFSTAACPISLPTGVEPVNASLSMPGCAASAAPASAPVPVTMFTTPGGIPASRHNWPRRRAVSGVSSAGLRTTVQPQARAGTIFQIAISRGKFHGTMAPTTPTGSGTV
ncbi:Uncharacterised protein [Acinetobacter baumannii]|nr:Uncharacterised protein [Acinetobacter baumannii]